MKLSLPRTVGGMLSILNTLHALVLEVMGSWQQTKQKHTNL